MKAWLVTVMFKANHRDTEECFALKFEILNPKHETNTKSEFSNVQNKSERINDFIFLVI